MQRKRKINEIIIHCTDTDGFLPVSIDAIKKEHISRGFNDIGYHYIIQPNGNIIKCRDISLVGAHCKNHNAHSIGIAYAGGRLNDNHADTRTTLQKESLTQLINGLCHTFPITKISSHSEYARKSCPCFDAKNEYSHLIQNLL